jgi:hypothetical protein
MEPEVHIVERYLQLVKRWFTMTNVMLDGGKEIDLLAFNPRSGERYHIEVRCAIGRGFRIRLVDSQTKSGLKHKRGLDTLSEIKFAAPIVRNAVGEVFGSSKYNKVLVVWAVEEEHLIEDARSRYGIEIWKMAEILDQLIRGVGTKAFRDDVLRVVQLISMSDLTG